MGKNISISSLLVNHSDSFIIIKETKKWGKIICVWDEVKDDGHNLQHIYSATINLKNGDIYLDCRRRKIWAKCASLTVAQPIKIAIKTAYHFSMIPVAKEIFKCVKGNKSKKKLIIKCAKSFADTARTPLYGVALTIVSLSAIIAIPFHPNSAYRFRETYGKIEQSLYWGEKHESGTLAICFQSVFNVDSKKSHYSWKQEHSDTQYKDIQDNEKLEILHRRLANFARGMIRGRRLYYNPFDKLIGKLDSNTAYKSPNLARLDPNGILVP